ncbi:beta-1,3-galactosyltransferase 1 [Lingula anatina]|uniref:Hexosyltransferase n=1 Tax=Lingula anatina TaxID=7574 RepID=A0A1S3JJP7_LINAN|nr:beta-1,3-galactosyltransferase 1 [Lingula anatina]|eukprot:XP_013410598.1 beta-1,3-galactosyltransferase 1 [Lingula anatina]
MMLLYTQCEFDRLHDRSQQYKTVISAVRRSRDWIHTKNYQYLLNNKEVCKRETKGDLFLIVLINSKPTGIKRRRLIRRTWGSTKTVNGTEIRTVYIMGRSNDTNTQRKLQEEQAQYGDLVQIDFHDSYDNLTVKTVMGLRWASTFCRRAKFVMKTDDDMFVNYMNLVKYLKALPLQKQKMLYVGNSERDLTPIRKGKLKKAAKWEISLEEYAGDKYPPYCSGSGFVLSMPATKTIYQTSKTTRFFRMEDVFIGICANKSGVPASHYIGFGAYWYAYSDCRFRFLITVHRLSASEMTKYWRRVNHPHHPRKCPTKELLIEWYDYDDEDILNDVIQSENASYYYEYVL